jgi:phosphoribosylformylglycinamidine cyclo-ligase
VREVLELLRYGGIDGIAHITGGGLTENIIRVVPEGLGLAIDIRTWQRPPVFRWLQDRGGIAANEMLRTFNCGIGLVLLVPEARTGEVLERVRALGLAAQDIGRVAAAGEGPRVRYLS